MAMSAVRNWFGRHVVHPAADVEAPRPLPRLEPTVAAAEELLDHECRSLASPLKGVANAG